MLNRLFVKCQIIAVLTNIVKIISKGFFMNIILLLTPKKQVTTVEEEMTVSEALQVMNVSRYTSVPLLNSQGQYVGTITEGDL